MIEYRPAQLTDAEELARLRVEFLLEAHGMSGDAEKETLYASNLEYFRRTLGHEFAAWLAVDEGEIIGTSGVSVYEHPPNQGAPTGKIAYIANMFTLPQHRGRGVATRLFALVVEEAKSRGCEKVMLNATIMGYPIYKKYGFADVAGDMEFYF